MSILTHETMTNHHVPGLLVQLGETLQIWRRRYEARRELSQWTDRDLHDIGLTHSDIAYEIEKPFWRA
jgi:uncharacterized protein YjiS (DUF1127 family)